MTLTRRSLLAGGPAMAGAAPLPAGRGGAAASDLDFASALEAARAIRSGQVSSLELTSRMLDRVAQHNGRLNAKVLGGPDGDEARAWRWSLPPARGTRLADYRIGYVLDDPRCPVAPEVGDALAAAVGALRRAGAQLTEGWPPAVNVAEQFDAYYTLLAARYTGPVAEDQLATFRQLAASEDGTYLTRYARAVTASDAYMQTIELRRRRARAIWQDYFRTHDAFLLPPALVTAFPHDHVGTPLVRTLATPRGERPYPDLCFWISFASLAGLPATTAPVGLTPGGLPVGIQIVGPYLEDATPIDLAGRLADVIGGFRPPPGF